MVVECGLCGLEYDDVYRLTYCPHEAFEMHTVVSIGGKSKCCHTIEEADRFLRENR